MPTVKGPRGGDFEKVGNTWYGVFGNRKFPVDDRSVIEWLDNRYGGGQGGTLIDARPLSNPTVNRGGQQYPQQVVLDPQQSAKEDFKRMNTLVMRGIYNIKQDRAGRAIYSLTDRGSSHNVRATGSGVENRGVDTSNLQPRDNYHGYSGVSADPVMDNYIANLTRKGGGRGSSVEAPGAREDYHRYGGVTTAPTVTPEGSRIKYQSGAETYVDSKKQAEQFIKFGIVAKGHVFIIKSTGERGVAE